MGDGYLVYGDSKCAACGRVHSKDYHIRETMRSRVRALRLCAEVATFGTGHPGALRWDEMGSRKDQLRALRSLREGRIGPAVLGYPEDVVQKHGGDPMLFGGQKAPGGKNVAQQVESEAELRDQVISFFAGYMHVATEPTIDGLAQLYRMDSKQTKKAERLVKRMVGEGVLTQIGNQYRFAQHTVMGKQVYSRMPVIDGGSGTSYMIGVLISGNVTYAAASGPGNNSGPFKAVIKKRNYRSCKERSADGGQENRNLAGRPIPRDDYAGAQAVGASPPGNCAAPRLIQEAMEDEAVRANFRHWEMSEVWYYPANDPTGKGSSDLYVHGVSAYHCATCQNLVPLLMHYDAELYEGTGKAPAISQEAMRRARPRPPGRRGKN